jgi:hypothetical protein
VRPVPLKAARGTVTLGPESGPFARSPSWPITALLVGYPLWWALGIADFMWIILAVPMAARMLVCWAHGSRRLRVPPWFGLWLLFLICAVAGVAVLSLTAPGTIPSSVPDRVLSYALRTSTYIGVTVLLLYAGNLTELELPRRRLAFMLGLVAIYATIGGLAGMIMPHLQFASPMQSIVPHSAQINPDIQAVIHPGLAQVSNLHIGVRGRPKAPFDYTNAWANCLTILVPWIFVGWWRDGTRRQRLIAAAVVVVAWVPLLYSVNRGAWVGAVLSVVYLAVRLATKGRLAVIRALCAGVLLVVVVVLATPLLGIISHRLVNSTSDDSTRVFLARLAVTDAVSSPVIGYGDTRHERGSPNSIAIGPTPSCELCGQQVVGGTGQLWLLLISNGIVGTVLYFSFFALGIWRYRRDRTVYGIAGVLVLLLSFVYMLVYGALAAPLGFTMLAYGLLWRNDMHLRQEDTQASETPLRAGAPGRLAAAEMT